MKQLYSYTVRTKLNCKERVAYIQYNPELIWKQRGNYIVKKSKIIRNEYHICNQQIIYIVINLNLSSSAFLIFTPYRFDLFSYQLSTPFDLLST